MADIRASTAKMWEDHAAGEDLVALLQTPGHGHSVMVQPEHPAPGHVYGATFVRIDEGRILKLRLPLDDGFESIIKPKPEPQSELPELIGADGKILPPLMGADGNPFAKSAAPKSNNVLADADDDDMDEPPKKTVKKAAQTKDTGDDIGDIVESWDD